MSIRAEEAADEQGRRIPELVRQAQAGQRAAFDRLYREHVDRVYGICLRMSGRVSDAERLTQDAFVQLWQRIGSFRGESEFTSWLYRLTVNIVLQDSRAERRRSARIETVPDPDVFERGTQAAATGTEDRLEIERAIAGLPPGARHALVMHDIEGYTHEEIAALTGRTSGSVKAQLHRARRLLREVLTR